VNTCCATWRPRPSGRRCGQFSFLFFSFFFNFCFRFFSTVFFVILFFKFHSILILRSYIYIYIYIFVYACNIIMYFDVLICYTMYSLICTVFFTKYLRLSGPHLRGALATTAPGASFLIAPKFCGQKFAHLWIIELNICFWFLIKLS
jgi:hypothetical protein